MPVFKEGEGKAPVWSELQMFEVIRLLPGQKKTVPFAGPKERYVNIAGEAKVELNGGIDHIKQYGILDIPKDTIAVFSSEKGAELMRLRGDWGEETGGTGIFWVQKADEPENPGDPADYPRNASFDNHFHDCDEYWIIFKGSGRAVSEGVTYDVSSGDCIATARGHHHDFPVVNEEVKAVFFETTLVGKKRLGHLWEHKHGPAESDKNRI